MNTIFTKIEEQYKLNLPFVAYRKPDSNLVSGFFMKDAAVIYTTDFTEKGFVFAPFNSHENAILFAKDKAAFIVENIVLKDDFTASSFFEKKNSTNKEKYVAIIEKALDTINCNQLKKVVISREEEIQLTNFKVINTFKKLLKKYTNAFVYVWFHPKIGLWFGATPEALLQVSNASFKTMSLAGTQVFTGKKTIVWKSKELEEQQMVTNFIESSLQNISHNLQLDKKETIKAGNLLHLKTNVTGILNTTSNLQQLIKALHPTPAVCGLPREKAKFFILDNEQYERTFYTGFLGEINLQNATNDQVISNLYVNLRCMQVKDNLATIYVGGGITKESNPEKEWLETVFKSKTIKQAL